MNKSAQQIHNDFHGQLVTITKMDGEKWVGIVTSTTGLKNPQALPLKTTLLGVDIISDLDEYKKQGVKYEFKHKIIDPADIDNIRLNKVFHPAVEIDYNTFKDLNLGINPTSKWEITENIKDNQVYIVTHQEIQYELAVDEDDNLILKPNA